MKGDCQKMLSFFFSFTIKVHLGCVYSGLVISRETFCFNELLWFEYFFLLFNNVRMNSEVKWCRDFNIEAIQQFCLS